jgi:hypothetical protein
MMIWWDEFLAIVRNLQEVQKLKERKKKKRKKKRPLTSPKKGSFQWLASHPIGG